MNGQRLFALDAARGFAMLLVCISHFFYVYLNGFRVRPPHADLMFELVPLTQIAAPAFVIISGVVLGYYAVSSEEQFIAFRARLLDRALFMIGVVHVLLAISFSMLFGFQRAIAEAYITDTVAFCIVAGVIIVRYVGMRGRCVLGILLGFGSCIAWLAWHPEHPALQFGKSVFLGSENESLLVFYFPLMPWLGLYLIGSSMGEWLVRCAPHGQRPVSYHILAISAGLVGLAGVMKAFVMVLGVGVVGPEIYRFMSINQKFPPGPFYMLLFGGLALLFIGTMLVQERESRMGRVLALMEPIGRNTLPIFVVQSFLYFTGLYSFAITASAFHPVVAVSVLGLSLVMIWLVALACRRWRVSKFLTLGAAVFLTMHRRQ